MVTQGRNIKGKIQAKGQSSVLQKGFLSLSILFGMFMGVTITDINISKNITVFSVYFVYLVL